MLRAPTFLDPTEKPENRPPFTIAEIILLNAFIIIMNTKGDKGSPYLKSWELLKKPFRLLFTKTAKCTKR
jgi:hypothetical protein